MTEKKERQSWDEYFIHLAQTVADRSTCIRRKVGAVAVDRNHRIIGTGYNGAPSGMVHCTPTTCIRIQEAIPSGQQLDRCKAIHAEANVVLHCGERLNGATVYCTTQPCISCLKLLIGAKIKKLIWTDYYNDPYSRKIMEEVGIVSTHNESTPHYTMLEIKD